MYILHSVSGVKTYMCKTYVQPMCKTCVKPMKVKRHMSQHQFCWKPNILNHNFSWFNKQKSGLWHMSSNFILFYNARRLNRSCLKLEQRWATHVHMMHAHMPTKAVQRQYKYITMTIQGQYKDSAKTVQRHYTNITKTVQRQHKDRAKTAQRQYKDSA